MYCMFVELFGLDYFFLKKEELFLFEELEWFVMLFVIRFGVEKICLIGGEFFMRKDMLELIKKLVCILGVCDIVMMINGLLLFVYVERFKEVGLKWVMISFDFLEDECFKKINGCGVFVSKVLEGIEVVKQVGFGVKINMVV